VTEQEFRHLVGARVRLRRLALQLTQQELADKAGVHRQFVTSIEHQKIGLDAWRLLKLADALAVDLMWLLDRTAGLPELTLTTGPQAAAKEQ
jgi:transcriptional regulator with XRE-family HTH domain